MGIDIHNLNFMAHAADLGARFDATIGIGRQAVFIDDWMLARHRTARGLPPLREAPPQQQAPLKQQATPAALVSAAPIYFEPMLQQWFGAREVDSVDASPYEQARLLHDMNLPWPADGPLAAARGRFDAVLDFGCLEHVFDFPVAWRNCVDLCRVGGHLLHALPANNLAGHGFYQFSPELFFNLYRPERGFELKALYAALKADPSRWWQVASPLELGRRVNLRNSHEVYLLVLAKKVRETGPLPAPQQSDYAEQAWRSPVVAPWTANSAASTTALSAPTTGAPASTTGASAPTTGASASTTGAATLRAGSAAVQTGSSVHPSGSRQAIAARLASIGLIDTARSLRERLRAIRFSGFELPSPDYRRLDVDKLIARRGEAAA